MLGTAKKIISILDFFTERYDSIKNWFKKRKRRKLAKAIANAIMRGDTPNISKRVREILKKRKDRAEGN